MSLNKMTLVTIALSILTLSMMTFSFTRLITLTAIIMSHKILTLRRTFNVQLLNYFLRVKIKTLK
jgi:hypothetical protein